LRAKFVIMIRAASVKAFPTNEELVDRFAMLGLASPGSDALEPYEIRRKAFQDRAEKEWTALPEVAADEKDHVVFFARLPDHGRIIVTRLLAGYATIRVIHDDLATLEKAAERIATELRKRVGAIDGFDIEEDRIEIYERGQNNVLLVGKVVTQPFKETMNRHPGDWISGTVTAIASFLSIAILAYSAPDPDSLFGGTLSRFSTAMIAAFFISAVTFFQHYGSIRRRGKIEWRPVHRVGDD